MQNRPTILIYFICIVTFLASQRFFLGDLSSYFFLLLYPILIIPKFRTYYIEITLLTLFLVVDNGGNFYHETNIFLSYFVYIFSLSIFLINSKLNIKKFTLLLLFTVILFFLTIINNSEFDYDVFKRSIQIIIILALVFTLTNKFEVDFKILIYGLIFFMLGELSNILFFNDYYYGEYLSYDSLKSLILLPFFYYLFNYKNKKELILTIVLFVLSIIVVVEYKQRMILVALILTLLLTLYKYASFKNFFLITSFSFLLYYFIDTDYEFLQGNKVLILFLQIFDSENILDYLKIIDPVRYVEYVIFFDRGFFDILFGDGLASGIYDKNGLMNMASYNDTSFSQAEIDTSTFYNFHDFITDFGLRFGLVSVILIFLLVIKGFFYRDPSKYSIIFIMLFCSFWSIKGLITIALFSKLTQKKNN